MMETYLLLARLLLSGVFGVAGVAKLFDRDGSRRALADFGVPERLTAPLAFLLPLAELATAAALLPASTARAGALSALALLVVFSAAIALNLARGRRPDCHCFGQISSSPAGRTTLARNLLLASAAAFVVWAGARGQVGPSAFAWAADLSTFERALLLVGVAVLFAVLVQAWLLFQVLRQQGRLLLRLDSLEATAGGGAAALGAAEAAQRAPALGLAVGTPAPGFTLRSLDDGAQTLDDLLARAKPVLLLFVHPGCGPCEMLLPEVARWRGALGSELTFALVSGGEEKENRRKFAGRGVAPVLLQEAREVSESYAAHGTPSAVVVGADGRLASPLAQGADDIRALVARTVGAPAARRAQLPLAAGNGRHAGGDGRASVARAELGQPAPEVELEDLNGRAVSLASLTGGRRTLLLFWNPGCGFCQRMLDDLRRWDASPPPGAPRLLVVSTGTADENRAMNLRSPVVLDNNFRLGAAVGASGTPTAVLLDADGRVASEVASGAPAVFALAGESSETLASSRV